MRRILNISNNKKSLVAIAMAGSVFLFFHFSLLLRIGLFFSLLGAYKISNSAIQKFKLFKNEKNTENDTNQTRLTSQKKAPSLEEISVIPTSQPVTIIKKNIAIASVTFKSEDTRLDREACNRDAERDDIILSKGNLSKSEQLQIELSKSLKQPENKEKRPMDLVDSFLATELNKPLLDFFIDAFHQDCLRHHESPLLSELIVENFGVLLRGGSHAKFDAALVKLIDKKTLRITQNGGYHELINTASQVLLSSEENLISFSHSYLLKILDDGQLQYQCDQFEITLHPDFIHWAGLDDCENFAKKAIAREMFDFSSQPVTQVQTDVSPKIAQRKPWTAHP